MVCCVVGIARPFASVA